MEKIETLLTPQIKSEGVTYRKLTDIPAFNCSIDSCNKVKITKRSVEIRGKSEEEIKNLIKKYIDENTKIYIIKYKQTINVICTLLIKSNAILF